MRIFLLGARPGFDVSTCDMVEKKLAMTGNNTGNQLIAHGLLQSVVHDHAEWNSGKGVDYVNENFDLVVVAAANFIFPNFDLSGLAGFLEKITLPLAVVGLGAQSKDYSPKISLKPGTERLMRIFAERAPMIGVRGPFTQLVLGEMGIHNVQVVGCPSYYMNGDSPVAKKALPENPALAINASRDVISHAFDREKMFSTVCGLIVEAVRYDSEFVAQTEIDEIVLADHPGSPEAVAALDRFCAFYDLAVADKNGLRRWAVSRTRVYWDIEQWLDAMKSKDFAVGTRFHGAMAALNVGVPAFVLCHDTRTEDMSKFLAVPHANICDVEKIDVKALYESADLDAFNSRRQDLLPHYEAFLRLNGLQYKYASR